MSGIKLLVINCFISFKRLKARRGAEIRWYEFAVSFPSFAFKSINSPKTINHVLVERERILTNR